MRTITIYPDYCSSGLWNEDGANMCESAMEGIIPEELMMLLKYWHWTWEFFINDEEVSPRPSHEAKMIWYEDGQKIVDAFNKCLTNVTHKFVYGVPEIKEKA